MRRIGEEVSETLDYVPGRFKVIRHVREKLSCRTCDTVIAAPAPDHAIARGRAGAGLLAHIVVSKFDDHLPLYRQPDFFAREGVSLETSTLSGWVGATAAALKPLVDALAANVFAGDTLYVDDTPVPVLAPGTGKTKTGRLWTRLREGRLYVRDELLFAGSRPPAALFFYSPDRKGEHPKAHLQDCVSAWKNNPGMECAPWGGQISGGGIDHRPGVLILELDWAQIPERGMEFAGVVDGIDEPGKIRGDVSKVS